MNKFFKCEEDFRVKVDIFRPRPKVEITSLGKKYSDFCKNESLNIPLACALIKVTTATYNCF